MKKILTLLALFATLSVAAQSRRSGAGMTLDGRVELDKTVHDFGDVLTSSGPLTCTFTVKNISDSPLVIYNVAKSCGCTEVTWTREEIAPGASGSITATYSNDEGPYPFSKTLTVYLSDIAKPVILRLRGTARSKAVPLAEMYPVHLGDLGVKELVIAGGNMVQGSERGDQVSVANLGKKQLTLSFTDISDGLTLSPSTLVIPAGGKASFSYTVTSSRERWGKNYYYMTPVVNGRAQKRMSVWAFTKEDFSGWTKAQRDRAGQPSFENSTVQLGQVKDGIQTARFHVKNLGKSPLHIHKADADSPAASITRMPDVPAGGKADYEVAVDVSKLPKGEFLIVIALTTDTPLRPLVNLFISGVKE